MDGPDFLRPEKTSHCDFGTDAERLNDASRDMVPNRSSMRHHARGDDVHKRFAESGWNRGQVHSRRAPSLPEWRGDFEV
jgi:hypothetical protein